ncbi:MAG: DUF721 domain-containing protein [Candidatus Omnitrophica bacterium]|nr:DUF721 domain-containing protein [Candidatus Omnitrophota bacterium]
MTTDKKPLEGALKNILGAIGGKGIFTEEDMAAAWERVVGVRAAGHSRVRSFRGSRLVVNVDGSSWLYELTIEKKSILKKLSSEIKGKKIKDITFRIGDLK